MANDLVLPEQQMPSLHDYQDQDTRVLLSMMVEFCHQSSNVLYLIIQLYV